VGGHPRIWAAHFRAVFFQPALFAVSRHRFLAQQPGSGADQARHHPAAFVSRVFVDPSRRGAGMDWMRLLGTNSLPVYWIHIELVYGRWFGYWKERLDLWQCLVGSLVLIVAMIALAEAWQRMNWGTLRGWMRLGSVDARTASAE
jgi:hypothetical protein